MKGIEPNMLAGLCLVAFVGAVRAADTEQTARQTWPDLQQIAAQSGLQVNVCNDISGEKFLCEDVFAEFCTYCRREDGNKCVTKKGVKRAEAGAHLPSVSGAQYRTYSSNSRGL